MPALSSDELTAIRNDIAELLPDTDGAVLSVTQTSDGMGGFTETWGTATGSLSYRLDPLRGVENEAGGGLQPFHGWQLTLPHDTTITTANRFEDGSGNQYNVIEVDTPKSWRASVRVRLEAV
jgi:head-tail adaptor